MRRARPAPALKPPGLLLKRWTGLVVLVLLIVPFLVPIPQELRRHPVISPLGDQLHIILLAAMTLFLYWRGPLTGRLGGAALAAAAIGGAIEFVQELFGRQAFLEDFVLDLVGIGLVVGWIGWRGLGRRAGLALVLLLVAVIPYRLRHVPFLVAAAYDARQQFPVLADLERPYDHYLWRGNGAIVTSETVADSPDGAGRVVRFAAETATDWPGAELRRFPHDWSAYDTLAMDVRLVSGPAATQGFGVRLDDFEGRRNKTWIFSRFEAGPEWRTIRMPLRERRVTDGPKTLHRIFDITDVDRVVVYLARPRHPAVLELDNLRLE